MLRAYPYSCLLSPVQQLAPKAGQNARVALHHNRNALTFVRHNRPIIGAITCWLLMLAVGVGGGCWLWARLFFAQKGCDQSLQSLDCG